MKTTLNTIQNKLAEEKQQRNNLETELKTLSEASIAENRLSSLISSEQRLVESEYENKIEEMTDECNKWREKCMQLEKDYAGEIRLSIFINYDIGIYTHFFISNPFFGRIGCISAIVQCDCLNFLQLVSYTFLFWLPHYISSTGGLDARAAATLSTFFDVGGILGGVLAGLVSIANPSADYKVFMVQVSDRSGMPATTCSAMLVAAMPVMLLYPALQVTF